MVPAVLGLAIAIGAGIGSARAEVVVLNGDFVVDQTDLSLTGGFQPKVRRVYNSKTRFKGIFGWNWGSEYELSLQVTADGSLAVRGFGGGARTVFPAEAPDPRALAGAVERMAEAAAASGRFTGGTSLAEYRARLGADAEYRELEWGALVAAGKVRPAPPAVGAVFRSSAGIEQRITRTAQGYRMEAGNGRVDEFDLGGRLVRISGPGKDWISLSYGQGGPLAAIADNQGRRISFAYNARGLVESARGPAGSAAKYGYNERDELTSAVEPSGRSHSFSYSTDGLHLLTLHSIDGRPVSAVSYHGAEASHGVREHRGPLGAVARYSYSEGPAAAGKREKRIGVEFLDTSGAVVMTESHVFALERGADGAERVRSRTVTAGAARVATVYHAGCGLPERIEEGGRTEEFRFDRRCRVIERAGPEVTTRIRFGENGESLNPTSVQVLDTSTGTVKSETSLLYQGASLIALKTPAGKFRILRDHLDRVRKISLDGGREIELSHDEVGRVVAATDSMLGKVEIAYDGAGGVRSLKTRARSGGKAIHDSVLRVLLDVLAAVEPQRRLNL